jgi:lysophospholipase L1-like esterase
MSNFSDRRRQLLLALSASLACLALPAQAITVRSVGALSDYGDPNFQASLARPLALPPSQWTNVFRWLHIGDSHTGGDYLTGELRHRLQERYGDAGVGWITPGYVLNQRSDSVKLSNENGWSVQRAMLQKLDPTAVPFGGQLGTGSAGAGARLTFKNPEAAQLMRVSVLQAVTGGNTALEVASDSGSNATLPPPLMDGRNWQMSSLLLDVGGERLWMRVPGTGADARATVGGIAIEKLAPGVVLDAVGVNGAQIDEFLGWSEEALNTVLSARPPNVVVLEFGTNEAVGRDFDQAAYIDKVATAVRRLRQSSKAAIILMLPPDIHRAATVQTGRRRSRSRITCGESPEWLGSVSEALRQVARQERTLVWDWGKWVRARGGACGTFSLANMNPPLARPDYVHFTPEGYWASADSFLDDLYKLAGVRER